MIRKSVPDPDEAQKQASHALGELPVFTGRQRTIIHIDMDAFFAPVEQRDDPELRGKPVAVSGSGERGVMVVASYEARKFGVRSAMATAMARRQCPNLTVVPPRFDGYREISLQIRTIFAEYRLCRKFGWRYERADSR